MANGQGKKDYFDEQSGVDVEEIVETSSAHYDSRNPTVIEVTHPSGRKFAFNKEQADSLQAGEYGPEDLKRFEIKDEDEDQHDKARRKVAGMLKESFRDMFWLKSVDERLDIIKVFRSLGGNKENEQ